MQLNMFSVSAPGLVACIAGLLVGLGLLQLLRAGIRWWSAARVLSRIPSTPMSWIGTTELVMNPEQAAENFSTWHKSYGDVFRARMFHQQVRGSLRGHHLVPSMQSPGTQ